MRKNKTIIVGLRYLHTYSHTTVNCLSSRINVDYFLSVFTHNPLVPCSTHGGGHQILQRFQRLTEEIKILLQKNLLAHRLHTFARQNSLAH